MSGNDGLHPNRDTLTAYGLGKLQPAESVAVEVHIAECEECCETLHDLGNDTFVDLVRESNALQLDSIDDDGTIGLHEAGNEAVSDLPSELANHSRYRVLELLGKGGMGNVYKAEHTLMNRAVALKVINRELVENAQAVERFRREVQSAAQLAHSNIVTAYDAEQAGDMHFLVMEYVPGDNLSDVVKRDGQLDISRACDYIRQAAQGLQHAHEKGMVHRDVKPHNLMVTSDGQIKILDFGLATLTAAALPNEENNEASLRDVEHGSSPTLTSAGSMMGTPDFISPEQASDARAADIRSDIYSLGCTFYYLLTGRPPFTEGSALERVKAHEDVEPEAIENVRMDLPERVADVVRRMMAKDPAKRFQTPAEVADALAPFVDAYRTTPTQDGVSNPDGTSSGKRLWWPPTMVQSLTSAAFAFILAGIIYVATDNGTLVVDSDDDHVEIIIHSADGLRIVDTVTGTKVKRLRSGEYTVDLKGDGNDFELSRDRFVLKRGGKVIVQVVRKNGNDIANKPDKPLILRQVWRGPLDVLGGVSPNGRYLSFVDWDTGDLAVRDLVLGANRRVTNKGSWDVSSEFAEFSRFSPNGKQLVYTWLGKDGYELRTVNVDGGDPRVIYTNDNTRYVQPMDWSPDGTHILAVLSERDKTNRISLISVEHDADVPPVLLKTLDWRYPGTMCFSPDGRYIVYDLPQSDGTLKHDVFVIATDGSGASPLIEGPADDALLGWSPKGNKILFASDRTGAWDAWLINVIDGIPQGRPEMIKPDVGNVVPLGFTSDGAFYFAALKGLSRIYTAVLDRVSGEVGPLRNVAHRALLNIAPAWSPNGALAYLSKPKGRRTSIVILSASGQERELTPRLRFINPKPPAWSPDEASLLVTGTDDKNRRGVFVVDVKTGDVEAVSDSGWGEWSPDGNAVYIYQPRNGRIYERELESKREREIVQAVEPKSREQRQVRFVVSPDGERIAFTTNINEKKSWVLAVTPIAGGDDALLYDIPQGTSLRRLQWTADGNSLVIAEQVEDKHVFSMIPVQGGSPRQLDLNVDGVQYLNMHPDGNQVALNVKEEGRTEIIAMENFLPPVSDKHTPSAD